jgi:hypothetical protein
MERRRQAFPRSVPGSAILGLGRVRGAAAGKGSYGTGLRAGLIAPVPRFVVSASVSVVPVELSAAAASAPPPHSGTSGEHSPRVFPRLLGKFRDPFTGSKRWGKGVLGAGSANLPGLLWCCRGGLNSRPPPYQGGALPLSYGSRNQGPVTSADPKRAETAIRDGGVQGSSGPHGPSCDTVDAMARSRGASLLASPAALLRASPVRYHHCHDQEPFRHRQPLAARRRRAG